MRYHSLGSVFAIGAVALVTGCGSSSSNNGGSIDGGVTASGTGASGTGTSSATGTGAGGSCPTGTSTGGMDNTPACSDCQAANCNTELTSCYGPGWKSGTFSG